MQLLLRSALATLLAAALLPRVQAQSVAFLQPDDFEHTPGDSLELSLVRELGGERPRVAWPEAGARAWLFHRADGNQENIEELKALGEERDHVRLALPHRDVNLLGLDLRARVETVSKRTWERFVEERVGGIPDTRELPDLVRVRRVESMKLLVRVDEPGAPVVHSATAQSKTGQTLELRPLADPTAVTEGSDLPVRVYVPDGESAGLVVFARHLSTGATQATTVREGGIADFRITAPGEWTIEVHQLLPLPEGQADRAWLELRTATLAFEAPATRKHGTTEKTEKGGKR